jgi:AbrB family looped-hinge helix DNA binding protein
MDANGRVLLPLGIRYRLDLNEGDCLAVDYLGDGTILLKKIGAQPATEAMCYGSQKGNGNELLVFNK